MATAFVIHGSYGNSTENWFPWISAKLEKMGYNVIAPDFPINESQNLKNWRELFYQYLHLVDENTVFIGHSLGPAFILDILSSIDEKVKACYLVAPFIGLLKNPEFDNVNHTFTARHFDWEAINRNCGKFHVYCSDNDPYVPFEKCRFIASKLNATLRIIPGGGHINKSAGYDHAEFLEQDL